MPIIVGQRVRRPRPRAQEELAARRRRRRIAHAEFLTLAVAAAEAVPVAALAGLEGARRADALDEVLRQSRVSRSFRREISQGGHSDLRPDFVGFAELPNREVNLI